MGRKCDKETCDEERASMGTDEESTEIADPPFGGTWLHPDCLEFYRSELLQVGRDSKRPPRQVKDRVGLLRVGINKAMGVKKRFSDALFLEFGVHEGKDLVRMATFLRSVEDQKSPKSHKTTNNSSGSKTKSSYTTFHGFDSFEGLPEDWINGQYGADDKPVHKRGAFGTGGELPDVDNLVHHCLNLGDYGRTKSNVGRTKSNVEASTKPQSPAPAPTNCVDNIEFHKGWFHESLPRFLDDHACTPVAFVHADADLYTSTLTFLRLICARKLFRRGSIIVFDEFWNYPNWENGEYKAWLEIVDEFGLESKYEYFGYHAPHPKKFIRFGYQSVGVVITSDMI